MAKLSPQFYKKLLQVSNNVGMKPEHILQVMASESNLDPTAHNPSGDASGIIQFMPNTLKGLGFKGKARDFRHLQDYKQLDYVEKLIKGLTRLNGGPLKSAAQYYVGNFIPAALTIPGVREGNPKTVICSKNPVQPHIPGVDAETETKFYNANKVFDSDKDGNITFGDMQRAVDKAASNQNYTTALSELSAYTNYVPENKEDYRPSKSAPSNYIAKNLNSLLQRYLQSVLASEKDNKKLYKKYLPQNQAVISINSEDYTNSVEFGRVLCLALDEELMAESFVHTDGNKVEVSVVIHGPEKTSFEAIKEITNGMVEAFEQATKKIGGINIKSELITNKTSSYQLINLKTAESQYRKFLLKFI